MEEVIPGIYRIFDTFVNVYIVDRGDHLVLVDTGIESTCEKIIEAVKKLGKPLKAVILTHGHMDHTGSLRCLKEVLNPIVASQEEEVEMIERNTGVKVDVKLKDGELFEGFRVLHKPGHTKGSICLLDEDSKSLFVGDLVVEENGKLKEVPHQYSMDPEMNRKRIIELLEVEFENLMPAHGNPIIGKGKEKIRELVESFNLS
ncbi:MBL fold metallo-hydrolase [Pyrococcus abyssi]|nr:MBL fold metallo-hydrolase [Pyrococcus abyssi]CCE69408.1 TPA: hypothetical protein PAB0023 [Pyrococcus abyssi GE5]